MYFILLINHILLLGQRPYGDKKFTDVMFMVCHSKSHLVVPSRCPNALANLLVQCWNCQPEERPSFEAILTAISELLTDLGNGAPTMVQQEANSPQCIYALLAEDIYSALAESPEGQNSIVQGVDDPLHVRSSSNPILTAR